MDPLLIPFGFGVGVLVGMTGMGGGSLMTPLLILVFGTAPVTAVGSDITYAAATKTVGGWRHLRLRTVNLGLSFWLAIGSVPAAIAGVWVIEWLHDRYGERARRHRAHDAGDRPHRRRRRRAREGPVHEPGGERERESFELTRRHKQAAVAIGASTGFVIGLTSAGSGTLIAVFLIAYYRMVPRNVVGTDVFHAAVLLWAAAIAHIVGRQRRLRAGRRDPAGLDPGRVDRQPPERQAAERGAANRARSGDDRRGAGAVREGRREAAAGRAGRRPGCPGAALGGQALARRTRAARATPAEP